MHYEDAINPLTTMDALQDDDCAHQQVFTPE
jgi:hypothetical protein